MIDKILVLGLSVILFAWGSHAQVLPEVYFNTTCVTDTDCPDCISPDVADGCGKTGQIPKCVDQKCSLVFEPLMDKGSNNSLK